MVLGISFCIPTYNRYETFVAALDSVLGLDGLDGFDYEILVSDDGYSQRVRQFVEGKSNPRIRYFRNRRHGQFNNLNNLVRLASKPWLLFLHDDDLLHREYLTFFSKVLQKGNRGVGMFFANRSLIGEAGEVIKERVVSGQNEDGSCRLLAGRQVFDHVFFGGSKRNDFAFPPPMVTGLAIKRELVERAGGFDTRLAVNADGLFLNMVCFLAKKVLYADSPLVSYRVVDDSERAKPSKQGIVYSEMKKLLWYTLDFLRPYFRIREYPDAPPSGMKRIRKDDRTPLSGGGRHFKDSEEFQRLRAAKVRDFYEGAVRLNGPLLWVALRYEGDYLSKLKILLGIVEDILGSYRGALLSVEFYLVVLLAILPQKLLRPLYRVYLK